MTLFTGIMKTYITSSISPIQLSTPTFRPSVFFKGPLLAISDTNKEILTNLSSLFFLKIYKTGAKQKLIEQQSCGDDESWPPFLIHNIKGLRNSDRLKKSTES